jgi:hypothetical protein
MSARRRDARRFQIQYQRRSNPQDFYLAKVAKRPDGKFQTEIVQKVFENYGDRYAKDCGVN